MKKLLYFAVCAVLAFSLFGCTKSGTDNPGQNVLSGIKGKVPFPIRSGRPLLWESHCLRKNRNANDSQQSWRYLLVCWSQSPRCKHTRHQTRNDASIGGFNPRGVRQMDAQARPLGSLPRK